MKLVITHVVRSFPYGSTEYQVIPRPNPIVKPVAEEPNMSQEFPGNAPPVWRLDASKLQLANRKAACFRPASA